MLLAHTALLTFVTLAAGGSSPLFDFYPGDLQNPPSVANLDPLLCINGACVLPSVSYKGGDAGASTWAAWAYGDTLTLQSGTAPTYNAGSPLLGSADDSVDFNAGGYYQAAASSTGDITTEDIVMEWVIIPGNASGGLYCKRDSGGTNVGILVNASAGTLTSSFDYGASTISQSAAALTVGAWYHVMWFVNRDENSTSGGQFYVNGVASGSGVNYSAGTASLTNTGLFRIGTNTAASAGYDSPVAYTRMWKQASWHQAGAAGPAEWATVAASRFQAMTKVRPRYAAVTYPATTLTRSTIANMRKTVAGVTTLFTVGANWPRVEQLSTITGYFPESALLERLLQSADIGTSWTESNALDTQSLNAIAAPDGTTTADGAIATVLDTTHCYSQADTATASTNYFSVFAKSGDHTWAYLSDDTVANATSYFDVTNCATGTKGAGATAAFVESYGNGWCRVTIAFTGTAATHTLTMCTADADTDNSIVGDAATVNTYWWGMNHKVNNYPQSYYPTTTATATMSADVLRFGANVDRSQGTEVCSFLMPNHDSATSGLIAVDDGTSSNRFEMSVASNDNIGYQATSNGSSQGSGNGGGDVSDGAKHTGALVWHLNDERIYSGGTLAATDLTVALPVSITTVTIGSSATAVGQLNGNIERCRVFNRDVAQ